MVLTCFGDSTGPVGDSKSNKLKKAGCDVGVGSVNEDDDGVVVFLLMVVDGRKEIDV
jgi:hypothetical protein